MTAETSKSRSEPTGLLFYRNIVALNAERHQSLRIGAANDHRFAAKSHWVPLLAAEFAEACKDYPIGFAKAGNDGWVPVAVLGFEREENLFIDGHGHWTADYVPAFVRRYPFILAESDVDPEPQHVVCVDETCAWLSVEAEGEPLFVGGKPSAYLRETMDFLQDYHQQAKRTARFGQKLADWNLLIETQAAATTSAGQSFGLSGFWIVDETALNRLTIEKLHELHTAGELGWVFLHLASLTNFRKLLALKNTAAA
ncbi:SapC family protein [Methylocaldum gracile]|jgi:hypothetical protein|uniref:SapC family protein n=1 Tax=unclassified Methylocaldum TaxID=2622260 RepID=UPI00105FFA19